MIKTFFSAMLALWLTCGLIAGGYALTTPHTIKVTIEGSKLKNQIVTIGIFAVYGPVGLGVILSKFDNRPIEVGDADNLEEA